MRRPTSKLESTWLHFEKHRAIIGPKRGVMGTADGRCGGFAPVQAIEAPLPRTAPNKQAQRPGDEIYARRPRNSLRS